MTAVSDRIIQLQSYTWNDWVVTQAERAKIIALLRTDPDMPSTLRDLRRAGQLDRMLENFVSHGEAGGLIVLAEVLGAGAGMAASAELEGWYGWTRVRGSCFGRVATCTKATVAWERRWRRAANRRDSLPTCRPVARMRRRRLSAAPARPACPAHRCPSPSWISIGCGAAIRPRWLGTRIPSRAAYPTTSPACRPPSAAGRRGTCWRGRSIRSCRSPIGKGDRRAGTSSRRRDGGIGSSRRWSPRSSWLSSGTNRATRTPRITLGPSTPYHVRTPRSGWVKS